MLEQLQHRITVNEQNNWKKIVHICNLFAYVHMATNRSQRQTNTMRLFFTFGIQQKHHFSFKCNDQSALINRVFWFQHEIPFCDDTSISREIQSNFSFFLFLQFDRSEQNELAFSYQFMESRSVTICLNGNVGDCAMFTFYFIFFSHFADTGIYRSFLPTAKHHISTINKCIRSRSVFVMQLIYEDSEVRVAYTHDIRFVFFLRCLCALLPAMKQTYLWLLFNKVITATASIWIFLR